MKFDINAFAAKYNVEVEIFSDWMKQHTMYSWHHRGRMITDAAINEVIERLGVKEELYEVDMPGNPMNLNPCSEAFEEDSKKPFSCVTLCIVPQNGMLSVYVTVNTLLEVIRNVNDSSCKADLKFKCETAAIKVSPSEFGLGMMLSDGVELLESELRGSKVYDKVGTESEVREFRWKLIELLK